MNKGKDIEIYDILENEIKSYIQLDNQLSRAFAKGNLKEHELRELELKVLEEKTFLLELLLNQYGYTLRKRNGYFQWYRKADLIEILDK